MRRVRGGTLTPAGVRRVRGSEPASVVLRIRFIASTNAEKLILFRRFLSLDKRRFQNINSTFVLLVCDLFHPFDDFAVERLLNGDMRHCCGRRGAVPMPLIRWAPNHIARPELHFLLPLALHPSKSGCDDQRLPERMIMPGCPSAWREEAQRTLCPPP